MAVPIHKIPINPGDRPVDVAQDAGIGTPVFDRHYRCGTVDPMAANGLEKSIRRVRHIAIVAARTGRIRAVMSMARNVFRECFMTLQAGRIRIHRGDQLIVWRLETVHRMTGQTRDFASLVTGRRLKRRKIASRQSHGSVIPEGAPHRGLLDEFVIESKQRDRILKPFSRNKQFAGTVKLVGAVALPADFR